MIQIAITSWRHNHIMSHFHCLDTTFSTSPRHDSGTRCKSTLQNLIPTYNPATSRSHKLADPPDHIALKLVHISQPLILHPLLTVRASLPMLLASLITADMDELRREHLNDLIQNSLKEGKDLLLAHAKITVLICLTRTSKLRISCEDLLAMTRHLDFRNEFYMPFCSITHKLSNLLLGIVTAVSALAILLSIKPLACPPILPESLRSPCCKLGKTRISIYLDSPSRSISQMQMHLVHLEQRHRIHLLLQEIHTAEMSRHVHMQSSVAEPRLILDPDTSDGSGSLDTALIQRAVRARGTSLVRSTESNQLSKSLLRIKSTRITPSLDKDPLRTDFQNISLRT